MFAIKVYELANRRQQIIEKNSMLNSSQERTESMEQSVNAVLSSIKWIEDMIDNAPTEFL